MVTDSALNKVCSLLFRHERDWTAEMNGLGIPPLESASMKHPITDFEKSSRNSKSRYFSITRNEMN